MQPFDIVDKKTKQFIRSYDANSREHALEQHYAELGRPDSSVKACGPAERSANPSRVPKERKQTEPTASERTLRRVRLQRRGTSGGRVTEIPVGGRRPSKGRMRKAARFATKRLTRRMSLQMAA